MLLSVCLHLSTGVLVCVYFFRFYKVILFYTVYLSSFCLFVLTEEVLNSDHALYFSKDGKYLTYVQFDDSDVKDFVFSWFGPASEEYITQHKIAYPKPGTGNPKVTVRVINLESGPFSEEQYLNLPVPSKMKDM